AIRDRTRSVCSRSRWPPSSRWSSRCGACCAAAARAMRRATYPPRLPMAIELSMADDAAEATLRAGSVVARTLRVATWNIHGGIGADGRYAPERIVGVL